VGSTRLLRRRDERGPDGCATVSANSFDHQRVSSERTQAISVAASGIAWSPPLIVRYARGAISQALLFAVMQATAEIVSLVRGRSMGWLRSAERSAAR
jgi:hypothetical protein